MKNDRIHSIGPIVPILDVLYIGAFLSVISGGHRWCLAAFRLLLLDMNGLPHLLKATQVFSPRST